jgi:hypothetical protein
MTQTNHLGRGGSTSVKSDGTVEHTGGGLNPGDPGYEDATRKAPIESTALPGTLNRRPGYSDRVASDPKPSKPAASRSVDDGAPVDPFFKPSKGDK